MMDRRTLIVILTLSSWLTACQAISRPLADLPTAIAPTLASNAASTATGDDYIDIGGRRLFITCQGEGSPTVILEAGLGGDHTSWALVQPAVAELTQVCSYDRAGIGQSDPGPTPRTSQHVVADLHALLAAADVQTPYILVGHSFGALHVRLYAHTYRSEVAGLVLVDPVHEDWWIRAATLIPPAMADDSERLQNFRRFMTEEVRDPTKTPEGIDIPASAAQVREARVLGDLPLIVLKAGIQDILAPGLPPELEGALTRLLQEELPMDLTTLSSLSIQLDVEDSGHNIPAMQPDAVVVAIRTMLDVMRLQR